MKAGQLFALITGIAFFGAGVLGFVPAFVQQPPHEVSFVYDGGFGYLMGIFPINYLHNIVHLVVGVLGIFSSLGLGGARFYGRGLFLFYGILAILGLLPFANTTFGLIPIFGNDVWLHAGTAAIAFYFGFIDSPGLLEIASDQQYGRTTASTQS